ncbi:hypothetical protein P872_15625 [Rhodonellum psychrophilum GCM71 = DSM 17998]|uniref:Uncharacterized protein n=1 Tax=Rhodonellum psychrophilum GCM71 = DSM 17998 TaxID=1123057 RepID=U5C5K2_9BACT|nr:hypothetical protein P872_15625 [Rhodonellum psychrophilum GCM71 = DSM 17998]
MISRFFANSIDFVRIGLKDQIPKYWAKGKDRLTRNMH